MTGCGWCGGSLAHLRRDAKYCCTPHRQAAHRAGLHVASPPRPSRTGDPLRVAYADPPYPKKSKLYVGHPDYAGEVDHRELVARLVDEYPDGWALSTSAAALPAVLEHCPTTVKVAAWVRGEHPTAAYEPLSSWEPVIYAGGRSYLAPVEHRRVDSLVHGVTVRSTDPGRVIGAKPYAFAGWLFDLLGLLPGDQLDDLYPGSGGIARAWRMRCDGSSRSPHDGSLLDPHDGCPAAAGDA